MLEQACTPTGEIDFEADVTINTFAVLVILDFVEPDITSLNCFEDLFLKGFG